MFTVVVFLLQYPSKVLYRDHGRPLDHSTGKGWAKHVEGDYPDRHAKRSRLDIIPFESYGGASPHTRAIVRRYARHASA